MDSAGPMCCFSFLVGFNALSDRHISPKLAEIADRSHSFGLFLLRPGSTQHLRGFLGLV